MITKIQWTDFTFNPWIGCTKVSTGCANCYAETQDNFRKWTPDGWGRGKPRTRTSGANWRTVLKMANTPVEEEGVERRRRIFSASLADWLDAEVPAMWLFDFLSTVRRGTGADWQLLTKRPELWRERLEAAEAAGLEYLRGPVDKVMHPIALATIEWIRLWLSGMRPSHVWVGASAENQEMAEKRAGWLSAIPAALRFFSMEPLLGPVDLTEIDPAFVSEIDWYIIGAESGGGARKFDADWAEWIIDDVREWKPRDTCIFVKQLGKRPYFGDVLQNSFIDPKGGDMTEWPPAFQVRDIPASRNTDSGWLPRI